MSSWPFSGIEFRDHYRVRLLDEASYGSDGVSYMRDGVETILPWSEIDHAIGAEIGEPEGVRTIVFDLVVSESETSYEICRTDADPGEDAMEMARIITDRLGPDRASSSIKSIAIDGIASRWYPDIESFERDVILSLTDRSRST